MTFFQCLPWIFLSVASMIQTLYIRKLSERISDLEHTLTLKDWTEAINRGESLSDIAYMQQKGFLK